MEAKILMSDYKSEYEKVFGSTIWEQTIGDITFADYAKEQVKAKLIRVHCMNIMAKEKGVVLSRSQSDAVHDAADTFYEKLSDSEIKELRISKSKLTEMFTQFAIADLLYEDMTSGLNYEISADEARVISIQYICTDTWEDIQAAKARLDAGDAFYMLASMYNKGQYDCELKRGEMEETFENVAFDLKTGETSGIVEAKGKFYLIKCTSDNENNKTEANKLTLIQKYKLNAFNEIFEKYEAKKYVDINQKAWEEIRISSSVVLPVCFEETYNQYLK